MNVTSDTTPIVIVPNTYGSLHPFCPAELNPYRIPPKPRLEKTKEVLSSVNSLFWDVEFFNLKIPNARGIKASGKTMKNNTLHE